MAGSTVAARARTMWCMRLNSACRTALACAVVGCATLYGPIFLTSQIKFAAFSYLTAVIIVSDSALGDALKGCWHALCATAQVVPLAVLGRWIFDPTAGIPESVAAALVGVASFLVALPECTHLTAKRIAFGQIVLVCTDAVVSGDTGPVFMHPVNIAASTALGALASVLAMLVPYPNLASRQVQKLSRIYAENASQRMNVYLRAFSATDDHHKTELISQAKPLAETGSKLLQSIRILQEGMQWERPWSQYSEPKSVGPGDRLQSMELQMRGIEYALVSSPTLPVQAVDQEQVSNLLNNLSFHLEQQIKQRRFFSPFHSKTEPVTSEEFMEKPLSSPDLPILKHGWVFFYFSCIDMLLHGSVNTPIIPQKPQNQSEFSIIKTFQKWIMELTRSGRLEFAFKCALSLSLAVLFGLKFDKENGCWAGLTIAISFVTGRQAIFTIANTRAQGTAVGSVYGVICCFFFHGENIRHLALLPWIMFTSFLRQSKMYGQTGGVSAAIAALLIVGRKNYGAPNEFALARLTEVFIGLSAFILVELFLNPIRAATLASNHLRLTLCALQESIKETEICTVKKDHTNGKFLELTEKQGSLNALICELKKLIADAEVEPEFWFLPFASSCYQKMVRSLTNIVDMLNFITHNFEILSEVSERNNLCKEFKGTTNSKLELFQETLKSLHVHHEDENVLSTDSHAGSQDHADKKLQSLEAGKLQNPAKTSVMITDHNKAEWNQWTTTTTEEDSENRKYRETIIQCLGATGFCINSLMKEIDNVVICTREINQWEKHSSQQNIHTSLLPQSTSV